MPKQTQSSIDTTVQSDHNSVTCTTLFEKSQRWFLYFQTITTLSPTLGYRSGSWRMEIFHGRFCIFNHESDMKKLSSSSLRSVICQYIIYFHTFTLCPASRYAFIFSLLVIINTNKIKTTLSNQEALLYFFIKMLIFSSTPSKMFCNFYLSVFWLPPYLFVFVPRSNWISTFFI